MVLDVTRWLPEHPGGSKIIPAQVSCRIFSAMLMMPKVHQQDFRALCNSKHSCRSITSYIKHDLLRACGAGCDNISCVHL